MWLETGLKPKSWLCVPKRPANLGGCRENVPEGSTLARALDPAFVCFTSPGLWPGQSPKQLPFPSTPEAWASSWWDPKSDTPRPVKEETWKCIKQGGNFYDSTKCLIVGTSPTTSMYQLKKGREHFRTSCAPCLAVAAEGVDERGPGPPLLRSLCLTLGRLRPVFVEALALSRCPLPLHPTCPFLLPFPGSSFASPFCRRGRSLGVHCR